MTRPPPPTQPTLEGRLHAVAAAAPARNRWLTKSELVALLAEHHVPSPEAAFLRLRRAAQHPGFLNGIQIFRTGDRHHTRYALGSVPLLPAASNASLPQDLLRAAPSCTPPPPPEQSPSPNSLHPFLPPPRPPSPGKVTIIHGDNLVALATFPAASFDLIYIDPPFNTGRPQVRSHVRTDHDAAGDRVGFHGRRYRTTTLGAATAYADTFDDYLTFLVPRLTEAHRVLAPTGSLFVHLDYREVHYVKVALDGIFGRPSFINEIIWAYDYGARTRTRWAPKHDTLLWYAKDPKNYCFNFNEIDRIPYLAPALVGKEKAARGKTPTDTWWHTIVSPSGREKTGYPTQKPLGILSRIVRVHSQPGDRLLDFFAGSGSFGEAGASLSRDVTLIDEHPDAIAVMQRRFMNFDAQLNKL